MAIGDRDAALVAQAAADVVERTGGRVVAAALVNNAGIMPLGAILEESHEVARSIVDVNLHGVLHGTKAVAPQMSERGHGHIVNIASAVGRVTLPHGATYSASKFAVVGFTEAARAELAPLGIDVSMVLPTVVEAAIRKPVPELWVPRWSKAVSRSADMMPRRLKDATARLMKADSALTDADPAARAAYEARVRGS